MKIKVIIFLIIFQFLTSCITKETKVSITQLEKIEKQLKSHDSLAQSSIMIVGTFHFNKTVLEEKHQKEIPKLIEAISKYNPTKIVLEWEPSLALKANEKYHSYVSNTFDISNLENEVYQLGFPLGKTMKHERLYFFDDQTEFSGSLSEFYSESEGFSFQSFNAYALQNDDGFYNQFEQQLTVVYNENLDVLSNQTLYNNIALRNSPTAQKTNRQRMHMYEIKIGIQKNWIGPDWLGRWYRRNIRMASNILKINEKGDRILVIVGDNHKWTLDMLFENIPDFELVSSWDYLKINN